MRVCYILEYKQIDSKGREKNAKHVGVFGSLEDLEEAKNAMLINNEQNISFHIYTSESWI